MRISESELIALVPQCVQNPRWGPGPSALIASAGNETRALDADEALRFATCQRAAPANPQLRLRRLLGRATKGLEPWSVKSGQSVRTVQSVQTGETAQTAQTAQTVQDITLTPGQLIDAISTLAVDREALLAENIVPIHVSDLDGTLWNVPIIDVLVYDKLIGERRLKPVIRNKLTELMHQMGLEPSGLDEPDRGVNRDVLRVKEAFEARKETFSREELADWSRRVYPMTSWALAGFTVAEVRELTRQVIDEHDLDGIVFAGARAKLAALQECSIPTVFFSASNEIVIREAIRVLFEDSLDLHALGTRVRITDDGVLTTDPVGEPCFREAKLERVREFLHSYAAQHHPDYQLDDAELRPLLASGDSPSKTDEQMLDHALVALATEPGTVRDVELAVKKANQTGRYFILDYLHTEDGRSADRFRVDEPYAGAGAAL